MSGTPQRTGSTAPPPMADSRPTRWTDGTPRLDVTVHVVDPGTEVVSVSGEVDMATSPALGKRILSRAPDDTRYLIIDLTGVQFLSAAGLTVLLAARTEAVASDNLGLCVVARHRAVLTPLIATGLHTVLDLQSDLARAYTLALGRKTTRHAFAAPPL